MTRKEWVSIGGDIENGLYYFSMADQSYLEYEKLPKEKIRDFIRKVVDESYHTGIGVGRRQVKKEVRQLLEIGD